eukprot:COSAG01_NODE_2403_length_7757_cov_4.745887_1_plen_161_part_00
MVLTPENTGGWRRYWNIKQQLVHHAVTGDIFALPSPSAGRCGCYFLIPPARGCTQLAHPTDSTDARTHPGCNMRAGDLLGSGTISGGAPACSPARLPASSGWHCALGAAGLARDASDTAGYVRQPRRIRLHTDPCWSCTDDGADFSAPPPFPLLVVARLC